MADIDLTFQPLSPDRVEAMGQVLKGSWGSSCWCIHPRLTDKQMRALPGDGPGSRKRRTEMEKLAAQNPAPGMLAYAGDQPVGWVAIAPRGELCRVDASRATPRVDDVDVWVIPCITIARDWRGQGIGAELIKAAATYAFNQGADAVEAYPRAGNLRTGDDNAYFGVQPLFRRAGFEVIRGPLPNTPKNWTPRVAMRLSRCG